MEKTSKELQKEFVNSMEELFSDELKMVMKAELEEKLDYEKSQ